MRCVSCGKPVGHLWEEYEEKSTKKNADVKKILDELGVERYCCRSTFLGHVELIDVAAQFKKF